MAIRTGLDDAEAINMAPMIDVVFNLLIFFLLGSAYANDERRIDLELPTVKAAMPLVDLPEEITVIVGSDARITVSGTEYRLEALKEYLERARKNYPQQAVAIRGSKTVAYQHIAEVVALCKQVGIARLDIVVLEP